MKIIFFVLLIFSTQAIASQWKSLFVPGAKCGDGLPFRILYKQGSEKKVSMELMGGGACWDQLSCWGPYGTTWVHPISSIYTKSYLTERHSPLKREGFTQLYFPYCTGDIWTGNHELVYFGVTTTYHWGRRNFELALKALQAKKIVDFNKLDSFLMYGSSAGAIGSLLHVETLNKILPAHTHKAVIADSPGLHGTHAAFDRFTQIMFEDIEKGFNQVGVGVSTRDEMVAAQLKKYCDRYPSWKIGFIQTTKDIVMSQIFGRISPGQFKELVMGPKGMRSVLRDSTNCSTHIVDGYGHALLINQSILENSIDFENGSTGRDFVDNLIMTSM